MSAVGRDRAYGAERRALHDGDERAGHRPHHLQRHGGGDRTILVKIWKRGNRYLRALSVRAAWMVLVKPKSWARDGLKPWIEAARKRLHHDVLAVALANKLALIAWAVLARERNFEVIRTDETEERSYRHIRKLVTRTAH